MKFLKFYGLLLMPFLFIIQLSAQVTSDYAVMLTADVDSITPKITLNWRHDPLAINYTVYRKAKTSSSWDLTLAVLPGTDSSYTDLNVLPDSVFEYQVEKSTPSLTGYGYASAAINLHPVDFRGRLILLVDNMLTDSLSQEIDLLMKDISGDGWSIVRHDISPSANVADVKSLIVSEYNDYPLNVRCLFLLGHLPVPYSGDLNPDGHPDHLGAWPADLFYGDMTGPYSDLYINDTTAARPENHNIPGDGKYDQSTLPGTEDLQVGRVDLHDMPSFPMTEIGLIRKYLGKDHAFRTRQITAQFRGLIDDNFGPFGGEAFAANGWRNFPPMLGTENVQELPYFSTLGQNSYEWSYACGGGWYQGAGGVGSTTDFANDTVLSVFTILFGSYFGDWDNTDNFLRAPLASTGYALTCCWAGRPNWQFHHMALGENIGYSTRLSQNNSTTYWANYASTFVHIALMGDPTLRMHVITPVSGVTASFQDHFVTVNWLASPDSVLGYYVYSSNERFGVYSRITPEIIHGVTFTDRLPVTGYDFYMVKAVKLQQTPSGSYYNLSTGITDSTSVYTGITTQAGNGSPDILLFPVPSSDNLTLEFNKEEPGGCIVSILDPAGNTISETGLPATARYKSYRIPVDQLSPGLYLLSVKTRDNVILKKFQIVK